VKNISISLKAAVYVAGITKGRTSMKKLILAIALICGLFITVAQQPRAYAGGQLTVNYTYTFDTLWDKAIFDNDYLSYQMRCPQLQIGYWINGSATYRYVWPYAYTTGEVPYNRPAQYTVSGCSYRLTNAPSMGFYTVVITPMCSNGTRSGVNVWQQSVAVTSATNASVSGSGYGPYQAKGTYRSVIQSCGFYPNFYDRTFLSYSFLNGDGTSFSVSTSWY
jgi:hypothetical protein